MSMVKSIQRAKQSVDPRSEVMDIHGKKTESIKLPAALFSQTVHPYLISQAVHVYHANQNQGTQSTKTRADVVGSTRKIYRQKGTGRARHGDIKAPIFVGGGIAHGPKPGATRLSMPKVMRRKTLASLLTQYFQEGRVHVVKGLEEIEAKTKRLHSIFTTLNFISSKKPLASHQTTLLVLPPGLTNIERAARNLPFITVTPVTSLNSYDILRHDQVVFVPASITLLTAVFTKTEDHSKKPGVLPVKQSTTIATRGVSKLGVPAKTTRVSRKHSPKRLSSKAKTKNNDAAR